jgi:predicted O-methyltransferase YrrM
MNLISRLAKPWANTRAYEWVESCELRLNQLLGRDRRWRIPSIPPTRTDLPVLDNCFPTSEVSEALDLLVAYRGEFSRLPVSLLVNCYFGPADAAFYWSFIRSRRPERIIEVGSGYSSRIAQRALEMNATGQLICIDPSPRLNLPSKNLMHIRSRIEEVDSTLFHKLEPRDILFIDSSHTSEEVNRHAEILESLPAGILVHYHDIDYPWERQSSEWDEDSVVARFLESHRDWKVIVSGSILSRDYLPQLRELIPGYQYCPQRRYNALWITRAI